MSGSIGAPGGTGGVGHDDRRYVAYVIFGGLAILFVTIVIVAITSIGSHDEPASASSAPSARPGRPGLPVYWTVRRGDTYGAIAQRTGLTIDELETFNPKTDSSTIQPGQRLKLRARVPRPRPKPLGPKTAVVRTGDSYGSIAAKTGRSIIRLQQLNPKLKATALRPGDRIRLR